MSKQVPRETYLPVLVLRGILVFPRMMVHFDVGRGKSVAALQAAMERGQEILLVTQRDIQDEDPGPDDIYRVGTASRVRQILKLPGNHTKVLAEGVYRADIHRYTQREPYWQAEVTARSDGLVRLSSDRVEALLRHAKTLFESYVDLAPKMTAEVLPSVAAADDVGALADYITQNISIGFQEKQSLLEELRPVARLRRVLAILTHEIGIMEIEQDIQGKLRGNVAKNQREYYLREQIKTIQQELGTEEDPVGESAEYREKIGLLKLPEEAEQKMLKEAGRLSRMNAQSPETAVIRTWLDHCLALPWNEQTKDRVNLAEASRILDSEHYGLEKVKERILEYLAVRAIAPGIKGQILCFVGPPGVGKTSVAMSVAKSLGRKLARLSLGGVRDEADIRGHRKTYIGAMPGRVMTAVQQAGSRNPVLVLDEVDKMGHDFRGDPAAALLELFDPNQNDAFRDHYLEVPFDLSEVLFITTANTIDGIPRALLDRMERIDLSSYTDEEKLHIAKGHLIPRQEKQHGLNGRALRFSDDAIRKIIAEYTRESGVRRLEREIASICRKTAKKIVVGECKGVRVTPDNLESILGPRRFKPDRRRGSDEVGVVTGLAWTQVGGDVMEIEVAVTPGGGKFEVTGNLGEVLRESIKAGVTYIRSRCAELSIEPDFYKNKDIHVHFPEGGTPKDGPSAGIAVTAALVSALTGAPIYRDVAMTGEITLRGRVLPIGGLKEKTMAAFRFGVRTVILPSENGSDLADIDPTVRSALRFVLADHMDDVLREAVDFSRRTQTTDMPEEGKSEEPETAIQAESVVVSVNRAGLAN